MGKGGWGWQESKGCSGSDSYHGGPCDLLPAQGLARQAHEVYLRVAGWVPVGHYTILRLEHNGTVNNEDSAERVVATRGCGVGLVEGVLHAGLPLWFHCRSLSRLVVVRVMSCSSRSTCVVTSSESEGKCEENATVRNRNKLVRFSESGYEPVQASKSDGHRRQRTHPPDSAGAPHHSRPPCAWECTAVGSCA